MTNVDEPNFLFHSRAGPDRVVNAGERFDGSSQGFVRADVGFYDDFGDDYDESKVRGTGKKGRA